MCSVVLIFKPDHHNMDSFLFIIFYMKILASSADTDHRIGRPTIRYEPAHLDLH